MDKDTSYMKSNYTDYKNLSKEDQDKINKAVDYFKGLKEEDVRIQSKTSKSS